MSDSENSKTEKDSEPSSTSGGVSGYQFFDATKDYSFSSQPATAEPAPATVSDVVTSPAEADAPSVVNGPTTTPVAPSTPPVAPAPAVPATPAPAAGEPAKPVHLSFGPNFNFKRSIVRVFKALDIDLSNRLSKKELDDGLASNKLHGDEYLLALTLLDYYDEIHKNVFGPGGPDMGASVQEILTYIGVKQEMNQSGQRSSRNPWGRY